MSLTSYLAAPPRIFNVSSFILTGQQNFVVLTFFLCHFNSNKLKNYPMPREQIILECSEAAKEGKPASRYYSTRNKRTNQEKVEKKKYNPFLKRRTIHREVKS